MALCTVPFVGAMVGLRFAVWYGGNTDGWVPSDVFQTFIVLAVFVAAVLLQGVVQDYIESEKLVCELQASFTELLETISIALLESGQDESDFKVKNEEDLEDVISKNPYVNVQNLLFAMIAVVSQKTEHESTKQGMNKTEHENTGLAEILSLLCASEINLYRIFGSEDFEAKTKKLGKPLDSIRKGIMRMYVIKTTEYITGCYVLLKTMVLVVMTLMATTEWSIASASGTAMAFTVIITFLFTFLWLLIRSLEDPFHYPDDYILSCYSDSRIPENNLLDELRYGGSINMSILLVDFGGRLQKLIYEIPGSGSIGNEKAKVWYEMCVSRAFCQKIDPNKKYISSEERDICYKKPFLHRWIHVLLAFPFVVVMVCIRLAVWYGGGVGGWLNPSVFTTFISLTVFVTALLLQGLIQDYKDAERMPSDLVSALLGLETAIYIAKDMFEKRKRDVLLDVEGLLADVAAILLAIVTIADTCEDGDTPADKSFYRASAVLREAEQELLAGFICAETFDAIPCLLKPLETVRQVTARMKVIQKTRYIPAAYSMVDSMVLIVLILMSIANWPTSDLWYSAAAYTTSVPFLFIYLCLLIRSIEDPFQYKDNYNFQCLRRKEPLPNPFDLREAFYSGSIDLRIVTVDLGLRLFQSIPDSGTFETPSDYKKNILARKLSSKRRNSVISESAEKLGNQAGEQPNSTPLPLQSPRLISSGSEALEKLFAGQENVHGDKETFVAERPISHFSLQYLVRRWRLLIWTLPFVSALVAFRLAVWYGGGVAGWVDPSVFTSFIGLVIFVTTMLAQGVVQDYKESERITSQIFSAFQALTAAVQVNL